MLRQNRSINKNKYQIFLLLILLDSEFEENLIRIDIFSWGTND